MEIHSGIRNLWQWDAFSSCCCLGGHIAPVHKSCFHRARMILWGFFFLVCLTDTLAYLNIYVRCIGTDSLLNMWAPYCQSLNSTAAQGFGGTSQMKISIMVLSGMIRVAPRLPSQHSMYLYSCFQIMILQEDEN